ncbi:regulator of G-protein signaling 5 [Carassius gibelio]|uniref:regulator of G-protein signaling 5 n=1 Tax=Carassius gibelio TaxID=101364 RepID=UPI002279AC9D|nr:regulator of G-protein signaling 5 [Carassius gibelio]
MSVHREPNEHLLPSVTVPDTNTGCGQSLCGVLTQQLSVLFHDLRIRLMSLYNSSTQRQRESSRAGDIRSILRGSLRRGAMCKGLSAIPSSCLEKAKGMRVKLSHLTEKQEWVHKHRACEKLPQDLESLLNSKPGIQAFRCFLRSEFSEENLEFWLACEEYKSTSGSRLTERAHNIYKQFINPDAPREVNLDSETREALMGLMEEPTADTFDEAQHRIFSLMAKDSFPRFLRSSFSQQPLRVL